MNKLLTAILVTILTTGLLITGCTAGSEPIATVGKAAPNFELQNLDGQSVSLSDFKGKAVLINFWNTDCPPCRTEMPYLQQVYDEMQEKGLAVLAMNVGESSATIKQYMQDNNLSLPVLLDTRAVVAQKYNIRWFPTTFFIDKDGIVRNKVIGPFPSRAAIESRLDEIMP